MGLNVGSLYTPNTGLSAIDTKALQRVSEQILNPNSEKNVDVSKLDLSKFNRVNIGTDLYAARTSTETAIKTAKAAVDFEVNFSKTFMNNIQYLNSQAAQSLFTEKEINGRVSISVDNAEKVVEKQVITAATQITESKDLNKDKRGSNPFSFYVKLDSEEEVDDIDSKLNHINIFA